LLSALILHSYSRFDVVSWLQNVHLKNKGSLPAEAVKPASTIGEQLHVVSSTTHTARYMACSARPQATAVCPRSLSLLGIHMTCCSVTILCITYTHMPASAWKSH